MHKTDILNAAEKALEADYLKAVANAKVYLENPVGIGEHVDVVEGFLELVERAATAKDNLDLVRSLK